jgi:hypothetical protein
MRYELYYQPAIQGRGEFVRLTLEDGGADYVDVARNPSFGRPGIMKLLADPSLSHPPFAPPFLKVGRVLISQTANILQFLGPTRFTMRIKSWRRKSVPRTSERPAYRNLPLISSASSRNRDRSSSEKKPVM